VYNKQDSKPITHRNKCILIVLLNSSITEFYLHVYFLHACACDRSTITMHIIYGYVTAKVYACIQDVLTAVKKPVIVLGKTFTQLNILL